MPVSFPNSLINIRTVVQHITQQHAGSCRESRRLIPFFDIYKLVSVADVNHIGVFETLIHSRINLPKSSVAEGGGKRSGAKIKKCATLFLYLKVFYNLSVCKNKPYDALKERKVQKTGTRECGTMNQKETNNTGYLYRDIRAFRRQGFMLCREKHAGKGEDQCIALKQDDLFLEGVFDGCGGSGARIYKEFGGCSGAFIGSWTLVGAVCDWAESAQMHGWSSEALKDCINTRYTSLKEKVTSRSLMSGSLVKEFPSTMAMFLADSHTRQVRLFWAGDSRIFLLDDGGLHQISVDDTTVPDAMRNLTEDAPMLNVIHASGDYAIHTCNLQLKKPVILIAATDGCFGYYPSPMDFERVLLETFNGLGEMDKWKTRLDQEFCEISGDDYTIGVLALCLPDERKKFEKNLFKRLKKLKDIYFSEEGVTQEKRITQWEQYRQEYEHIQKEHIQKKEEFC